MKLILRSKFKQKGMIMMRNGIRLKMMMNNFKRVKSLGVKMKKSTLMNVET